MGDKVNGAGGIAARDPADDVVDQSDIGIVLAQAAGEAPDTGANLGLRSQLPQLLHEHVTDPRVFGGPDRMGLPGDLVDGAQCPWGAEHIDRPVRGPIPVRLLRPRGGHHHREEQSECQKSLNSSTHPHDLDSRQESPRAGLSQACWVGRTMT
ncbi:hypothetical protein [Nocardia concava]|uniref:hypothetical protein n=1 Tax=Nocardia concava TaxID=257281 RepID=UPI000592B3B0|nr:hypothetical protein [Nocardia concava]